MGDMTMSFDGQEQEQFRLILVLPQSQMILAERYGETLRLPQAQIPRRTRTAQQLCAALWKKWAMRSIVIDLLQGSAKLSRCAVIEVQTYDRTRVLDGFVSVPVDHLDQNELTEAEHFTVRHILAGNPQNRGPFSRLGWIEEALEWIRRSVPGHRVGFDGDIRQANAGGFFALVRFGTLCGPAYWLKATGAPNTHELIVTQMIARYAPDCLPPLIATRTDWNAWITEDTGQALYDIPSLAAFEQSAHCLARLQIASVAHVEDLLACGCFDQRLPTLRAHLQQLMRYLEDAMVTQTSTKVAPLNHRQLQELGSLIEEASLAMERMDIPDSLIHNDMNPSNILFDGKRAVFTDWSEAGIGNPVLTFHHLQALASNADATNAWAPRLRVIYKAHWSGTLSESQIARAFALCPLLALASHLCGRDPSFTSCHRESVTAQSYARTLARQMHRLARAPEFVEALCR
jgi:hypothetical protein